MRTRLTTIALATIILFAGLVSSAAVAQTTPTASTSSLIVKVIAGLTADQHAAIVGRNGGTVTSSIPTLRLLVVSVPQDEAAATLARYQADAQVQSAEANKVRVSESMPSDALYANQWALPRIGWDQVFGVVTPTGSASVALLDTGVDASHPELGGKVIPGTSILDGSNGMTDPSGHGTWLAGIVAAQTNNGLEGIAGVAYDGVTIMPVTVLNANGEGQDSDVIAGVIWAADHGADVILMAFSNPGFSPNLQDAIDYAWSRGAVIVASAGNNASSEPHFPAGDRGVMGVAATDQSDGQASFSNEGQAVFIAAPGIDIATIEPGGAYTAITGTSAAAAHVAGLAAFMKAFNPTLSNGIIVFRIASTADPAATQVETGNGRINMARALFSAATDSIRPTGAAPLGGGGPFVGPYRADAVNLNAITIGAQQGALTAGTAGSATFAVSVNGNGNGTISVQSVTGLPTGASFSVSPGFSGNPPTRSCNANNSNGTECNFTLTIATTTSAPAGSFAFTVNVTSDSNNNNSNSRSATGTLTIQQATFAVAFNALDVANVAGTTKVLSVTVGASPAVDVTKADLPKTFSVPPGTNVSYSYVSPLPSTAATKRYRWNSAAGTGNAPASSLQSGNFTVTLASSVTASYMTQFKLTLATNPAAVGTSNIAAAPASADGFYDDGQAVQLTAAATVAIDATSRYKFKDWTGDLVPSPDTTNPVSVTMNQARSFTANYTKQFKLTLATNPGAVGVNNITAIPTSADSFYNDGQSVELTAAATITVDANTRYKFKEWTGDLASSADTSNPVSVTMNQARSLTANYVKQFKLTLATSPADVGISNITASPTSTDGFYHDGQSVQLTAAVTVVIDSTTRYKFKDWTGDLVSSPDTNNPVSVTMNQPRSVTANYVKQFKLTLTSAPAGVGGTSNPSANPASVDGFYDDGTSVSISAASPVVIDATSRYRFTHWTGDASGSTNPVSVTMNAAKSVTANYVTQFKLTLLTAPPGLGGAGNPSASPVSTDGFYDNGTAVSVSAASPVVIDATSRYRFTHWTGDGSGSTNPVSVTMNAAKSVTANYVTQFKLTLLTAPPGVGGAGNPSASPTSPDGFYDDGTSVSISAANPVVIDATSRYRFTHWTGEGSGTTNPVSITMNGAKTVTANYVKQFLLSLAVTYGVPGGLGNISGGTNASFYDDGTILSLKATTTVAGGADNQWGFDSWTGDVASPPNRNNPMSVTMNQARSITANYSMPTATFAATTPIFEGGSSTLLLSDATTTTTLAGFGYSFACNDQGPLATTFAGANMPNPTTCGFDNNGTFTVKGRVVDRNNGYSTYQATVTVVNVPPTITSLSGPAAPVAVNTQISITANFTDPGSADTHTCKFEWDDYTSTTVAATGTGNGSCAMSHSYAQAGVYTVRVTVTDSDKESDAKNYEYVVVYDPSAGFVTGGGWIMSPEGAYRADTTLTGKANFGFVSKYKKGATVPTGETEFQFHAGGFNFHSSTYQYLVIAGSKAQYKGEGTVNGSGYYGFMLTAMDGNLKSNGPDMFRIKIWDKTNGDAIVYDNVYGNDTEDIDYVQTQSIGGGSIVIHSGK
jgi:hypothetical protein